MNKRNQAGFGAIEGILILIIVGVVGFIGWYVWHSKNNINKSYNNSTKANLNTPQYSSIKTFDDCKKAAGSVIRQTHPEVCETKDHKRFTNPAQATNMPDASAQECPSAASYLEIKEWGIKVKLGSADPSIVCYQISADSNSGEAPLSLKSSVTSNSSCQDLGIGIEQTNYDPNGGTVKKVGNYWYHVEGSPYACGDSRLDAIRTQYTGNNPLNWEYSAL